MRFRPSLTIAISVLLLPLAGCVGGGVVIPCGLAPSVPSAPPTIEAPHSRFHPVPTRPVFAPRHLDAAPWPAWEPEPIAPPEPKLLDPPDEPPLLRNCNAAPLLQPPQNGRSPEMRQEPTEPRRLELPLTPPRLPSSRRVAHEE